jgi:hypothetical protein
MPADLCSGHHLCWHTIAATILPSTLAPGGQPGITEKHCRLTPLACLLMSHEDGVEPHLLPQGTEVGMHIPRGIPVSRSCDSLAQGEIAQETCNAKAKAQGMVSSLLGADALALLPVPQRPFVTFVPRSFLTQAARQQVRSVNISFGMVLGMAMGHEWIGGLGGESKQH